MPDGDRQGMPTTVLLDNYDSYTYNLLALIERACASCRVWTVRNDEFASLWPGQSGRQAQRPSKSW